MLNWYVTSTWFRTLKRVLVASSALVLLAACGGQPTSDEDPVAVPTTPTINIADASSAEGGTALFIANVFPLSADPITFDYTTYSGTATIGSDLNSHSGSLSMAANQSTITIAVVNLEDSLDEANETYTVSLSNLVGVTGADIVATGTINDNDASPTLSVSATQVTEGQTAVISASLSAVSGQRVTVNFATVNSSALSGSDYTAKTGVLTIPAGSLTQANTVSTINDTRYELSETFNITLTSVSAATLASSYVTVTISDNDSMPSLAIFDSIVSEGNTAAVVVSLSALSGVNTILNAVTLNNTAIGGTDFTALNRAFTIAAGSINTTIPVVTIENLADENNRDFSVSITSVTNANAIDSVANVTITDDDNGPNIYVTDATTSETGTLEFLVTLAQVSSFPVTFNYLTAGISATLGVDFIGGSGSMTLDPGVQRVTIAINPIDDGLDEANETLAITLSSIVNATAADTIGIGTITDDDAAPLISLSANSVVEGQTATIEVTLSAVSGQNIIFDYTTLANTAVAGSDFTATTSRSTITAGNLSTFFTIATINDGVTESDETLTVTMTSVSNATAPAPALEITITDDDSGSSIFIYDAIADESGPFEFIVSVSPPSASPITFNFATASDSALSGSDFSASSGTATIDSLVEAITISVLSIDDSSYEPSETFQVSLSNLVGANFIDNFALGTITDNDSPPDISIFNTTIAEGDSAQIVISLSEASGFPVSVDYATADGTATSGVDYAAASGRITISPAAISTQLIIPTIDNSSSEPSEVFSVTISNPANGNILMGLSQVTITDSDIDVTLSAYDASTTEGGTLHFIVSLSQASPSLVTFDYSSTNGTAISPGDFVNVSSSGSISPGDLAATILIITNDDGAAESSEQMTITLSNIVNAAVADPVGLGTINDNDGVPQIFAGDTSINESMNATVLLTLSSTSASDIIFQLTTYDNTATAPADYTTTNRLFTISSGLGQMTVGIPIIDDSAAEGTESFLISLSNFVNVTAGDDLATIQIIDNDPPSVFLSNTSTTEGGNLNFVITLSNSSISNVSFTYQTVNGTASAGSDFTAISGTATIAIGAIATTIAVNTSDDSTYEGDEAMQFIIGNFANSTGVVTIGTGDILDNEAAPSLFIGDIAGNEGQTLSFLVSLSSLSATDITMDIGAINGTATGGSDFSLTQTSITIISGQMTALIPVTTASDGINEDDETFSIALSNAIGATIVDGTGVGTIYDMDAAPQVFIFDSTAIEGATANLVVSLSAVAGLPVSVDFTTLPGTASITSDYLTQTGSVTIPAGLVTASIPITNVDDILVESTEDFSVSISNPLNSTIADAVAILTITDNDTNPNMTIQDATTTEGGTLAFLVSLSAPKGADITVAYTTINGSATVATDYTALSGTLTIPANTLTATLNVLTINDIFGESTETMSLSLSSPVNAVLLDNLGLGTINDDDSPPILSVGGSSVTEGGTIQFVVSLSYAPPSPTTFNYTTVNGSATVATDYTASSGLATMVGIDRLTISVPTVGDELIETTESFTLTISSATYATITISSALGTINDDDICSRWTQEMYRSAGTNPAIAYDVENLGALTIVATGYGARPSQDYTARRSTTGGTTWATTDAYQMTTNRDAQAKKLAKDSSNNLYSVGYARFRSGPSNFDQAVVRKSTDGGATWANVDAFFYATDNHAYGNSIHVDSNNKITAVGRAQTSGATTFSWYARQSTNGGTSWTTIDTYQLTVTADSSANAAATDSLGNLYVVGYGRVGAVSRWLVRKYNGSTWSIVDNYQLSGSASSEAQSIRISASNEIYVAGFASDGVATSWLVRKSTDGGSTWSVVDSYQLASNQSAQANDLQLNSLGHIYVVGQATSSNGQIYWLVRRSQNGGSTWTDVDTHQTTATFGAYAYGIRALNDTDFMVAGDGRDASGSRWVTRKMYCP